MRSSKNPQSYISNVAPIFFTFPLVMITKTRRNVNKCSQLCSVTIVDGFVVEDEFIIVKLIIENKRTRPVKFN